LQKKIIATLFKIPNTNTLFIETHTRVKQLNHIYIYIHRVRKKNGTNNILGITLTKFNKFSQFLAQFMLTCLLTKKS